MVVDIAVVTVSWHSEAWIPDTARTSSTWLLFHYPGKVTFRKDTLMNNFLPFKHWVNTKSFIIVSNSNNTVKPDLTTTCEQRPPVNNGQFESSTTSLNFIFIRHLCQTATFFRSQEWPLYTGLTVLHLFMGN
jgi:hypothetical protein